jgi:hypothetical protein
MKSGSLSLVVIAWLCAGFFVVLALGARFWMEVHPVETRVVPPLGALDSTHLHASILIMNADQPIFLCDKKYMLASQEVHFEDDNCSVVHAHATGVTLMTFLDSIDVSLDDTCLSIPDRSPLCRSEQEMLRVVVNGMEMKIADLRFRELVNNDHILINYGSESGSALRFKYNQVPSIPVSVNQPASGQIF